jgi:hypothetical protein
MDVEGLEDKVLLGGSKTITKYKPTMLIEIHQVDIPKVNKILEDLNYKIVEKYGPLDYLCVPV